MSSFPSLILPSISFTFFFFLLRLLLFLFVGFSNKRGFKGVSILEQMISLSPSISSTMAFKVRSCSSSREIIFFVWNREYWNSNSSMTFSWSSRSSDFYTNLEGIKVKLLLFWIVFAANKSNNSLDSRGIFLRGVALVIYSCWCDSSLSSASPSFSCSPPDKYPLWIFSLTSFFLISNSFFERFSCCLFLESSISNVCYSFNCFEMT